MYRLLVLIPVKLSFFAMGAGGGVEGSADKALVTLLAEVLTGRAVSLSGVSAWAGGITFAGAVFCTTLIAFTLVGGPLWKPWAPSLLRD